MITEQRRTAAPRGPPHIGQEGDEPRLTEDQKGNRQQPPPEE